MNIALDNLEPQNLSIVLQISQCNYLLIVSQTIALALGYITSSRLGFLKLCT